MSVHKLSRERMAQLVAADIDINSYVNLGIGMPTLVADYLDPTRGVILHSENGILGLRGLEQGESADPDLMNATKEPVMLVPGSSITDHVVSFCMMRGGHLDLTVLGAFQVSATGDLANWDTGQADSIPAVGGAMDLVAGARKIFVMMQHQDKDGSPKIVQQCTYPLTGARVVDRIYTDLAVIDVLPDRLEVRGLVEGISFEELQERTGVPLKRAATCAVLRS
ncbi:3-oxoacid CoA-transferase subunit B (plasmid) [Diaphorobacter sp. HDW4B]|uniref:3-oxoacid CoA-transferase subunit B n=1 Tax=Diaphorobacter sp. HDW4B TaxID=2714925 RepID=UPI00140C2A96|nr:3-oxoacid CoA-transferase subunit B [Diaphorobacter sp. HDW4B]QIL74161.1 3-oxoacid CoA-transferase subunit B [Diaphorobacter sp. HDW4B]